MLDFPAVRVGDELHLGKVLLGDNGLNCLSGDEGTQTGPNSSDLESRVLAWQQEGIGPLHDHHPFGVDAIDFSMVGLRPSRLDEP